MLWSVSMSINVPGTLHVCPTLSHWEAKRSWQLHELPIVPGCEGCCSQDMPPLLLALPSLQFYGLLTVIVFVLLLLLCLFLSPSLTVYSVLLSQQKCADIYTDAIAWSASAKDKRNVPCLDVEKCAEEGPVNGLDMGGWRVWYDDVSERC